MSKSQSISNKKKLFNDQNQFNFLFSFSEFLLNKTIPGSQNTYIFYPVKKEYYNKINEISTSGLNKIQNQVTLTSKAVDFAVA